MSQTPHYVLGNYDDRRLANRLGLAKAKTAQMRSAEALDLDIKIQLAKVGFSLEELL